MSKYKIEFEKDKCIGATSCVDRCPDNWEIQSDGKAAFKTEEITEEQLALNMEAAQACPVQAIHIVNTETKEKLI
jgi:ferredoxin